MKSVDRLGMVVVLILAAGCAETRQPPPNLDSVTAAQLLIESAKYNGKLVAAIGFLAVKDEYLYLDANDALGLNLDLSTVYVRPKIPDGDTFASWLQSNKCAESLVRVYGRFHSWSPNEAWIDNVYLITTAVHRSPGPEDVTCWVDSDVERR